MDYTVPPRPHAAPQHANGDREARTTIGHEEVVGLGCFHKSLPHNEFGEVEPKAFQRFLHSISAGSLEDVASGDMPPSPDPDLDAPKLVNPPAADAREGLGPEPFQCAMGPAPRLRSLSSAAEMTELYWMALLRDVSFNDLQDPANADVQAALRDLQAMYGAALAEPLGQDPGRVTLGTDLPASGGSLNLNAQTLFRCGLPGEDMGPLVSQFFLNDVAYGTQLILQKLRPYKAKQDYLTDYKSWFHAQQSGRDPGGFGYANDNSTPAAFEPGWPDAAQPFAPFRRFSTMRDLARFVNKDALHQAYFNAALLLNNWKAPLDPGNPYTGAYHRQAGFGTLGGPNILALVSEVASRALKAVWFQKWNVHLRGRPEAYAGAAHMERDGLNGHTRAYGLPAGVFTTEAAQRIHKAHNGWFLPMAFSAGSPVHPAYGAGHATVAGACVTVLKAWFKEDTLFADLIQGKQHPITGHPIRVVQPGDQYDSTLDDGSGGKELVSATNAAGMTIEGELNKLASNVAMGRSMGGVHWRTDNTRSLRLGQQVATFILQKLVAEDAERPLSLSFRSFNGHQVKIEQTSPGTSRLTMDGHPVSWSDVV